MAVFMYIMLILVTALVSIPLWAEVLRMAGHLQTNYRGRTIPQSMGGIFPPVFLVAAAWARWLDLVPSGMLVRALIVTVGFGVLGLIDDIWGDDKAKGLGGHFKRLLFHGEATTGLLKAVGGFLVAFWAVAGLPGFFLLIFWRAVLVALSANLLNLLDLRPGRSLKVFFLLSLVYIWRVQSETGILLLLPFLLASLAYFTWDLSGRGMMGDAGSNVLGGMLGLVVVLTAPGLCQFFYMVFLLAGHIAAEKVSLTRLIAQNSILRFFDNLGRAGWEK